MASDDEESALDALLELPECGRLDEDRAPELLDGELAELPCAEDDVDAFPLLDDVEDSPGARHFPSTHTCPEAQSRSAEHRVSGRHAAAVTTENIAAMSVWRMCLQA